MVSKLGDLHAESGDRNHTLLDKEVGMLIRINPEIEINQDKIYKRMKVKEEMQAVMDGYYEMLLAQMRETVEVDAVCLIEEESLLFGIEELDACMKKAICYVNIGSEVVENLKSYFSNRQYMLGYLLNEMLGETIMQIAGQLRMAVREKLNPGENMTVRYSPGEKGFPLENQVKLFERLQNRTMIKGTLNEAFMIVPDKAMLFVYGIGDHLPENDVDHVCTRCTGNRLCPYRTGY